MSRTRLGWGWAGVDHAWPGVESLSIAGRTCHRPLRVLPSNPRYFTDGSGKAIYLAGSHDGGELQDYAMDREDAAFPSTSSPWRPSTANQTSRMWTWKVHLEHEGQRARRQTHRGRMPYRASRARKKPMTAKTNSISISSTRSTLPACDPRPRGPRSRRLRHRHALSRLEHLPEPGGRGNPWPYHPFNRANNVNGLDGDLNGDGQGREVHAWLGENHPVTQRQRAYVRKVIDTVNDLDNVLYEIANESHLESADWQYRMIDFVHAYERGKPKQHPVGMTVPFEPKNPGPNSALFDSPADWISPSRGPTTGYNFRGNPPVAEGRKVLLVDTDHIFGIGCKDASWVWKTFCRGHNCLYMDEWTHARRDPARERVRAALGHTRLYAQRLDLNRTVPQPELSSTRYCLCNPGRQYLVFIPKDGEATVDLSAVQGPMAVEWFDPQSSKATQSGQTQGGKPVAFRAVSWAGCPVLDHRAHAADFQAGESAGTIVRWTDWRSGPDASEARNRSVISREEVMSHFFPRSLWMCCFAGTPVTLLAAVPATHPARPNIIFILADDLGYGDLGCYGQKKIRTPHIDRMAAEGIRFTQAYCGTSVCAPSRCSLMTGLHVGHTPIRGNVVIPPEGQKPLPAGHFHRGASCSKTRATPPPASASGALGMFGTTGDPLKNGFDYFFGYNCQRHAHSYFPSYLWRNAEHVPLDGKTYSHDLIASETLEWIRRHKDEPFFLYAPFTLPHGKYEAPDAAPYEQEDWPEVEKTYASMITRLDSDTGRILALLKELNLDERTVVFFASDNGAADPSQGHRPEFFQSGGPLRGLKRSMYEGGLRSPMIVRWLGRVPAGKVSDEPWAFWDFLPTCAELIGARIPPEVRIDGLSVVSALLGGPAPARDCFYWELHRGIVVQAVRFGNWKAVRNGSNRQVELYDLADDPFERRDLAAEKPEVLTRATALLSTSRSELPAERPGSAPVTGRRPARVRAGR